MGRNLNCIYWKNPKCSHKDHRVKPLFGLLSERDGLCVIDPYNDTHSCSDKVCHIPPVQPPSPPPPKRY